MPAICPVCSTGGGRSPHCCGSAAEPAALVLVDDGGWHVAQHRQHDAQAVEEQHRRAGAAPPEPLVPPPRRMWGPGTGPPWRRNWARWPMASVLSFQKLAFDIRSSGSKGQKKYKNNWHCRKKLPKLPSAAISTRLGVGKRYGVTKTPWKEFVDFWCYWRKPNGPGPKPLAGRQPNPHIYVCRFALTEIAQHSLKWDVRGRWCPLSGSRWSGLPRQRRCPA